MARRYPIPASEPIARTSRGGTRLDNQRDALLQRAAQRAIQLFEDEPSLETRIIMRGTLAAYFDQARAAA